MWGAVGILLAAFAIPWFLWESPRILAGLPVWLWWHIGWLLLTSGVFAVFVRTAWGVGVETEPTEAV